MRRSMRHRPVVLVALALLTLFVWARHHGMVAGLWMVAFVSFEVDGRSCAFLVELDGRIRAALEQLGVAVVTP